MRKFEVGDRVKNPLTSKHFRIVGIKPPDYRIASISPNRHPDTLYDISLMDDLYELDQNGLDVILDLL